ncbi:MAG: peptide ABC transporter substrate-binding protein [Planctomycetes bacterium]|nr:peptide ABC transporter substrate-binding protein [Planctomycetota bacterium]
MPTGIVPRMAVMGSRSNRRGIVAAALLLGLPIAGFVFGRPGRLPEADLRFVLPKDIATLDPHQASSFADGMIAGALFEGLCRIDPDTLSAIPGAALRFDVDADGLGYTFHLRPDGRWSDGTPLTAADFVWSWRRALEPSTGCPNRGLFRPLGDCAGVIATDAHTLRVRLVERAPWFPALTAHFAFSPVRRDLVERFGDGWSREGRHVGNGAYRLVLRRLRDRVRLEKNPYWHDANDVALNVIDAYTVDQASTALNLFLTGQVDWVNRIPPLAITALVGQPELSKHPFLATNILRFNVTRDVFKDVRVRRAFDFAVDRETLCGRVYREGEVPAATFVPRQLRGASNAVTAPNIAERAREALAEAGFPEGRGFPEVELLFTADESVRRVAEAMADRWREVLGVKVRVQPQESKVFLDSMRSLRYDVCLGSWTADFLDPTTFLDVFRSDSSNNRTGWKDPAYDALLDEAATLVDQDARAGKLAAAESYLLARGPIAPVAFRGQANLVSGDVFGFTPNLLDLHPLDRLRVARR